MSLIRRVWCEGLAAAVVFLTLGCGGDDEPIGTTGSIQVAVNPAALSLPQGTSGSVTASLTRSGGFGGIVTLAVTGFPGGVAPTITPAELSGATASATVTTAVSEAVAPGSYTATITATADGVEQATTTYQLTVTAAPPSAGNNVEYRFCGESGTPVFFAYQDGSGAWQTVAASTAGGATKFGFNLTQGRGGVLSVFRSEEAYETDILYGSTAELAEEGIASCAQSRPTKTVTGTVTGVSSGQYGTVSLGGATEMFIGGISTNPVTFADVPDRPVDFVGARRRPGIPPDRIVVFRDLDVPDEGALPATIDFDGPASLVPATASATITGGGGDDLEIYVEVVTNNTRSLLYSDLAPSEAATRPWAGLKPADMRSGDFHNVVVFATPSGSSDYRVSLKYVGPVADVALPLGPTIPAPTITQVVAGAYPRFRFQGTFPSEYQGASIDVAGAEGSGNTLSIIATGAFLAASGNALAYDFTMPDVSGLTGFPPDARLTTGANDVSASAFALTGPGVVEPRPSVGSEFKAAIRGAAVDVP